jgi:prevent-host-death family protein
VSTVNVLDASLPDLVDAVERGEEIVITRHGAPVARLVPVQQRTREEIDRAISEFREARKGLTLGGLSIKELRDAGRR